MRASNRALILAGLAGALVFAPWQPAAAQSTTDDRAAAIAVADSVLAAISRTDFKTFASFLLDDGVAMSVRSQNGLMTYRAQTKSQIAASPTNRSITERGFAPTVLVSGPLAVVWYPYDLYIDGQWSHCGVDSFTMFKVEGRWRVSSLQYSVEQPPACAKHPSGPPK